MERVNGQCQNVYFPRRILHFKQPRADSHPQAPGVAKACLLDRFLGFSGKRCHLLAVPSGIKKIRHRA